MKIAVIVAHPDDEIIWAGGLIIGRPEWEWTVFALCRGDDADRRPKFERICMMLGIEGLISDLDDGDPLGAIDVERDIGERVLRRLGDEDWDLCLTHGRNGEYGHRRHRQVHEAVAAIAERGALRCRRLWTFAYEAASPAGECRPAPWADVTLPLAELVLAEKRRIVRDEYGYPEDGFEVKACISPEGFVRLKGLGDEELI